MRTSPGRGGPGGTNVMTRMMTKTLTRMMTRILRMMTTTHLAHKPRQGRSRGHHAFPAVKEEKADEDCVRADFHTRHCFLFSQTLIEGKSKKCD